MLFAGPRAPQAASPRSVQLVAGGPLSTTAVKAAALGAGIASAAAAAALRRFGGLAPSLWTALITPHPVGA